MEDDTKPGFILPIIAGAILFGLAIVIMVMHNCIHIFGGFGIMNWDYWGDALTIWAVGMVWPVILIVVSVAAWILHVQLSEKTDFQSIPLIFGIGIICISALIMTLSVIGGFMPLVSYTQVFMDDMTKSFLFPFYLVQAILSFVGTGVMSMGLIGGIKLVKH